MFKKIVIAVVLLGFAWSVPTVRMKVTTAIAPVLGLLGPVGYRMQEPMRTYRADTDLKFLADQLEMDKTEGRAIPSNARDFTTWMMRRKGAGDRGKDPWGNLYWMDRGQGRVDVGSNGPDGTRNTADDRSRPARL